MKIIKIVFGVIIFFTLPTLLLFGYGYFKYNEPLPKGIEGPEATALAKKMLNVLNYDAYKQTQYIAWTFKKRHHYKWKKNENSCIVFWKNYKVTVDLTNNDNSKAYKNNILMHGEASKKAIDKAVTYFNNDSFWLVAPYKVFDPGTKRAVVHLPNNQKGLLVTYASGGTTPGDSYLWLFDENGKPKAYKMWTSILPINGLEASWSDWKTTTTNAQLPTFHKLLFLGLELDITEVK